MENIIKYYRNIGFSFIFLVFFGIIIYLLVNVICDNDRMFYSTQLFSFACRCDSGYQETDYGCFKAKIPENAHKYISTNGWCCDSGYLEVNDKCIKGLGLARIKVK